MKDLFKLKPKHQDTVIASVMANANAIKYHNDSIKPHLENTDKNTKREYEEIYADYVKELNKGLKHMDAFNKTFNSILCEYNYTVEEFKKAMLKIASLEK